MQNEYITIKEHKDYVAYVENAAELRIQAYGRQYREKLNKELKASIKAIEEMLEYVQEPERSRIEKHLARMQATLAQND